MELSVTMQNVIIAIVALLLYAFAWRITRDLPSAAAALARLALALVLVVPALLAIFFGAEVPRQTTRGPNDVKMAEGKAKTAPSTPAPTAPPVTAPPAATPKAPTASAPTTSAPPAEADRIAAEARAKAEAERRAAMEAAAREAQAKAAAERSAAEARAKIGSSDSGKTAQAAEPAIASPPTSGSAPPVAGQPPAAAPPTATPPVVVGTVRESAPASAPPPAPPMPTVPGPVASAPTATPVPPPTPAPVIAPEPAPAMAPPTGTRGAVPGPVATPLPEGVADVIPVFFGTDRGRDAARTERLDYTSERARRLELGRAMITVPKSHQVPEIERPWAYTIPFTSIVVWRESEDPKKHFTIRDIRALSKEDLLAFVRERLALSKTFKDHALVFVHGFNTTFDFALYRTAQIAYDLKFDGAPFVYSWPSRGRIGLVDYNYDRESTQQAEPHLKAFLEMVTRETGAKTVTVIAHSMGNQALMPVLRLLKQSAPEGVAISQLIFAAPDVDRDNFEFLAREIAGVARGSTLLAASNDRALDASMQLAGGPRAGHVSADGPLVLPGIDTIDVSKINTDLFSLGHAGFAESKMLVEDLQRLILQSKRLPDMRAPPLVRVDTANGPFWRYP